MISATSDASIQTNILPGDDPLGDLFGAGSIGNVGTAIQGVSNQIANLQQQLGMLTQQNSDVANGRWTLNNLAAQWQMMEPGARMALALLAAGIAWAYWHKA